MAEVVTELNAAVAGVRAALDVIDFDGPTAGEDARTTVLFSIRRASQRLTRAHAAASAFWQSLDELERNRFHGATQPGRE